VLIGNRDEASALTASVLTHIHAHTHTHIHTRAHIHANTDTCTKTHTYTHTYTWWLQPGYVRLALEKVSVVFKNQDVLTDASWAVQTGDRVGLVGANGLLVCMCVRVCVRVCISVCVCVCMCARACDRSANGFPRCSTVLHTTHPCLAQLYTLILLFHTRSRRARWRQQSSCLDIRVLGEVVGRGCVEWRGGIYCCCPSFSCTAAVSLF